MTSTAETLKEFVDNNIDTVLFPVKSKDRINIGSYSIKSLKGMYSIKCYKNNNVVAKTYTKAAALAIAKNLNKNLKIEHILQLDDIAAKHRTDCMFYSHTLSTTDNEIKREVTKVRYDISKNYECNTLDKIKQFIL